MERLVTRLIGVVLLAGAAAVGAQGLLPPPSPPPAEAPDPYRYRGVPMQSPEVVLHRLAPDFTCGPALAMQLLRADRVCTTTGEGNRYAGQLASSVMVEFLLTGLCIVAIDFAGPAVRPVLLTMRDQFGQPASVRERTADGREVAYGSTPEDEVAEYVYRWTDGSTIVSAAESHANPKKLHIEYSTQACAAAREQRAKDAKTAGIIMRKPQ